MANAADNFNRSNRTLDTDTLSDGVHTWSDQGGGWNILSNVADTGAGTLNHMVINPGCSDVDVGVTVATIVGTNSGQGVCFRWTDTSNYWQAWLSTDRLTLTKREAGTNAQVATASLTGGNGDSIRVHAVGDQISVYRTPNGGSESLVISAQTSSFNQTATRHGVFNSGGTTAKLDDFYVTDLSGGPSSPINTRLIGGCLVGNSRFIGGGLVRS